MTNQQQQLIARAIAGDAAAFEQLIAAEQTKIYNLAYRLSGNAEDAADLTQEALLKIYRFLPSFRQQALFSTWTHRIVVNLYRDSLRKKINQREFSLSFEQDGVSGERQVVDESAGPAENFEQVELREYLQQQVNLLPEEYRSVITLREYLEYSYEEIAVSLDISIGTVKSRLNRGRKLLRQKILLWQEQNPAQPSLLDKA